MILMQMVAYAALVGFVGMGFVWYGWGLTENVRGALAARRARKALASGEAAVEGVADTAVAEKGAGGSSG